MAAEPNASPAEDSSTAHSPAEPIRVLTATELGMVKTWVELADALGLPKSLAQIYGLIFTSKKPVSAQDCVDALKISRSSAGQGLKVLRDIGAIRAAFHLGARREAFIIEPDLGLVMQGMAKSRVAPAFDAFFAQTDLIEQSLNPQKDQFLMSRIQKLHRWRIKLGGIKEWLLG